MVPSKFGVNWPFGSGEEAKNRFSRWRPWRPSRISDRNDFSYFWSTSHPDASYQVSSQLVQGYRRSRLLKQLLTPHDRRRTTDDGHWLTTIAHHEHFVLRWAKKQKKKYLCRVPTQTKLMRILTLKLEAQVGQKLLTWIRLIMIYYIVPWWPSWLSDQIAFRNPESDVVWRVSRLPTSWILELNDLAMLNFHVTLMPPIKLRSIWYGLGGDAVWRISRWPPWWSSWILEQQF